MDSYSSSTPTSRIGNFVQSLSGIFIGPLIFIGAVIGLYFVEGQTNYAKIAKTAPVFSAAQINPDASKYPLVALNGTISLDNNLGDGGYLTPHKYLMYAKKTEIYAWQETKSAKTITDEHGNSRDETTVTYAPTWTTMPAASSSFTHPKGHENPTLPTTPHNEGLQPNFKLGAYTVSTDSLQLPTPQPLQLSSTTVTVQPPAVLANNAIYTFATANSSPESPHIGDIRTTYSVIQADQQAATIYGKIDGTNISVALFSEINPGSNNNGSFKRLFMSSPREAIATMLTEYSHKLLIGRAVVFCLMWIGLLMLLSPFSALFAFIPLIGGLVGVAVFTGTLIVTIVRFALAFILFNMMLAPFYVLAILMSLIGLLAWFLKRKQVVTN